MSKLTPPAPQHPLRRLRFFMEHEDWKDAKYEVQRIEKQYPHLTAILNRPVLLKKKDDKPQLDMPKEPEPKKPSLFDKVKRWIGLRG